MLRIIIIGTLITILLLIAFPLILYLFGINIFPLNRATVPAPQFSQTAGAPEQFGILIRSEDGGLTWHNAARSEDPSATFPSAVYSFVFHPTDRDIIYLGGKRGGFWKSVNGGLTWNQVIDENGALSIFADVHDIKIASDDSDIIYVAAFEDRRGRILRSDDGGAHFSELFATSADNARVFALAIDPVDTKHILAVTGEHTLIETINTGGTWRVKKVFTKAMTRLVSSPDNAFELFGINSDGELFKSVTGGNDWNRIVVSPASKQSGLQYPPDISFFGGFAKSSDVIFAVDPSNFQRIYMSLRQSLLRSEDGGLTWKELNVLISKELLPVETFAIDPRNSSTFFLAAGNKIQQSTDDGATWRDLPLPAGIAIKSLMIDPKDFSRIFAVITGK